MKRVILLLILSTVTMRINAQTGNTGYDKKLAESLGADDYGMKMYVLAILKTGSNRTTDKKITDSLFKGHMANINRLVATNKLVVAGPLEENDKSYRGIFILNVPDIEDARKLVGTDPAVMAGIFDVELYQWYGSAALPEYLKIHDEIEKIKH